MSERLVDESPPGTPLLFGLPLGGVVGGGTLTRSNSAGGDSWNVSWLLERAAREVGPRKIVQVAEFFSKHNFLG